MKKTENIDESLLETLRNLQTEINQIIIAFGEIFVTKIELQNELKSIEDKTNDLTKHYSDLYSKWEFHMTELYKKYNEGEINLNDGTVTYEE